jgi:hypothetical protein
VLTIFTDLGPLEILDIALVAFFAYVLILSMKRAKAA